jgi:CheY-like chemotaxis protein
VPARAPHAAGHCRLAGCPPSHARARTAAPAGREGPKTTASPAKSTATHAPVRQDTPVRPPSAGSARTGAHRRSLHPDVFLVDIGLGDESGFDLARLLTSDGRDDSATVILISAHPEVDYAEPIAESPAAGRVG